MEGPGVDKLPPEPSLSDPAAVLQHSTLALAQGPSPAALALLARAVQQHAGHAGLAGRHADALQLAGDTVAAVGEYERALKLDPRLFEAWYGLGAAQLSRRAYAQARAALEQALALQPDAHGARCTWAQALFQLGEVDAAAAAYTAVLQRGGPDQAPGIRAGTHPPQHDDIDEASASALASLATLIPGAPSATHAQVLAVRQAWAQRACAGVLPLPRRPAPAGRKTRLAYLSAFFGASNWMKPVFGVINHHDRSRCEVHLISDGDDPSAAAGYVEHEADQIWQVRGMPNHELAQHLANAGIDVLVDLNGYSLPARLGLFPHRPARVQIGWFNMFATTGVPGMDLLVGDAASITPEEEPFYSERIGRVPGSYLAFSVLYPVPPVAPPPCLARGHLTFGCLGSAYKLTPGTLDAWAAILRAAPSARLLVKNPTLDDEGNRSALLQRLAERGVARERVSLPGRDVHLAFLRAYDDIDIALDTFPYNGGTTTTEALWQGVPVLSCQGDRWAGRTSRSLLLAAGLADWVAEDLTGFVARGVQLATAAQTPQMLAELRTRLRPQLAASPACDSAGLCAALETIYDQALWLEVQNDDGA